MNIRGKLAGVAVGGVLLSGGVLPAAAATSPPASPAVSVSPPASPAVLPPAPPVQLITNQGGSSLCMNRQFAGTGSGTRIIGYNCGDPSNDFEFITLSQMCGGGKVTQGCPFTNPAYNSAYAGDTLVAVEDYTYGWCAGSTASNTFALQLEGCPNNQGVGGGWNSTYVVPGFTSNTFSCVISIHSTNAYGGTSHIYGIGEQGYRNQIAIATGTNNTCSGAYQWKELFS